MSVKIRKSISKSVVIAYKNAARSVTTQAATTCPSEELKPWSEIPTPPSLPIIGQLHHYFEGGILNNRRDMQHKLYEAFGPMVRVEGVLGIPAQLYLFDPECSAEILRGENWAPIRPGFFSLRHYRDSKGSDVPKGLITEDGEKWKKFRTTANPVMLQPKTVMLYEKAVTHIADDMVQRMKANRDAENKLTKDIGDEMSLWALESVGVVALGRRLNCLTSSLPEDSPEMRLIRLVNKENEIDEISQGHQRNQQIILKYKAGAIQEEEERRRDRAGDDASYPVFEQILELDFKPNLSLWIKTPAFRRAMKVYADQEKLIYYFVKKTQEELKASKENDSEDNKSIIQKLLDIDEDYAVSMANDILFAGVDTISNAAIFALYEIAKNPEAQRKLRHEVTTVSKFDDRKYLKACVKETFRLHPLAPGNLRLTTKEYNLRGYRVPKNTMVIMFHELMCRLENQYPRPLEFIPERWYDKNSPDYSTAHPFTYAPFGFGVRTCIGRRIAQLELETLLAKLIQNFEIEWSSSEPLNVAIKLVNAATPPYHFVFKDVK